MYVSQEALEQIKRANDLVEVIRGRGVELTRKGHSLMGLCPFHEDHTPSLVVDPDKQLWNCLGACGAGGGKSGGDVIAFVMKKDGLNFVEALKRLGYEERPVAGRSKSGPASRPNDPVRATPKPTMPATQLVEGSLSTPRRDLLRRVVEHYHRTFRERPEGQDYLRRRGLSDPEMFGAFEVGYADGSLVKMLDAETSRNFTAIGILTATGRELLLGCVVFPLTLPDLGVIGFYGRHATRDQHLFLPGPRRGVFHWQAMKGSQEVILTESVIDAATLYQVGFRNVSAVYGTQGFTADHEDLLQRFRVRRVCLCLDNDDAGSKATEAIATRIRKLGIDATDARVPGSKDPNALFLKLGPEAMAQGVRKALEGARRRLEPAGLPERSPEPPPLAAAVEETSASGPPKATAATAQRPGTPQVSREEGVGGGWRIAFPRRSYRVRGLTPNGLDQLRVNLRVDGGGRMHVETLDLYSHRSRSSWLKEATEELGAKEEELAREVNILIAVVEGLRLDLIRDGDKASRKVEIPDREREAALQTLRAPNLIDLVLADFERVGFVGERTALSVGYLATVSRFLDDPLGVLIVSRSGAGKSSLQDAVCDFVPPEFLSKFTRITGQALFYKESDSLVHKVLAVDEEKGAEDAGYSLRILQSEQELSIAATRTDPETGKLRTEEYKVRGPVSIFLTTTAPEALHYETRNRFVQVGIDESPEQTRRILERQRRADTLEGVLASQAAEAIRARHHNMQRLLRPLKVVNPYVGLLTFPDRLLQMRREHRKYLTLIKAIALLHQHQREVKRERRGEVEVEYVEVIPQDITLANRLAGEVLGHSLDELAPPTRELLKHLVGMARGGTFTRQDVREATGWSDWNVRVHLGQLLNLEYVVIARGGNGQRISYQLLFNGDPDEHTHYLAGLVDVEELAKVSK